MAKHQPHNIDHAEYRTWQINQSFVNMNKPSKLDLSKEQYNAILSSEHINKVYPNIKTKNKDDEKTEDN